MVSDRRIVRVIKRVLPAVVSIAISKHLEDVEREMPLELYSLAHGHSGQPNRTNLPHDKKRKNTLEIPEELVDSRGMLQVGGGSGFIVDSEGLILTNKHVVSDRDAEYTVLTADGRKFPAAVLSCDPINDIAILRIEQKKLPTVPLGDASRLELGETVIAIGNALGIFQNTVSVGIVAGLSRSLIAQADSNAPPQEMRGLIQTDAAFNPGNSGGPLVDSKGRAVGINAAIIANAQNICFAIPVNAARRDLDDVKKYGRIRRPYLGVRYLTVDDRLKEKWRLLVDYGAIVMREGPHGPAIVPGSPAARAGLKEHDIILEINGERVDKNRPIQDFLDTLAVGEELTLTVQRGGNMFNVKLTLGERI